jgi:hypothetical protein
MSLLRSVLSGLPILEMLMHPKMQMVLQMEFPDMMQNLESMLYMLEMNIRPAG